MFGGVRTITASMLRSVKIALMSAVSGKAPTRGECRTPRLGRAVGGRDLDTVAKVEQALRMRGDRHAEADDGDALACQTATSVIPGVTQAL